MVGTNPADLSWQNVAFKVLGNRSAGAAELRFALVGYEPAGSATMAGFAAMFGGVTIPDGGAPVTIPIQGRTGVAPGSWQFESGNPAAVYSAAGTITINCTACDWAQRGTGKDANWMADRLPEWAPGLRGTARFPPAFPAD
jgi:hypothetical protein